MIRIAKRRISLAILLLIVLLVRFLPHAGERYAQSFYPCFSSVVSYIASFVPFSLDEWIVICAVAIVLIIPFYYRRKKTCKGIAALEMEVLCWMTLWFYVGWGMNYFRDSIFDRANVQRSSVDKVEFKKFLSSYTDSLNVSYVHLKDVDKKVVRDTIKSIYFKVPGVYGLCKPSDVQKPKTLCFNKLYSSVGVLGYMGPFADESHLNDLLMPQQYAFVYAHELAHLLSVSSEAEANYWAYVVCIKSHDKGIRYSGYYGILSNVVRNAREILTDKEYEAWYSTIDKRIIAQGKAQQEFWKNQYSPLLGNIQNAMFNALLKSNRIPDGKKNYDQVLSMIISLKVPPL